VNLYINHLKVSDLFKLEYIEQMVSVCSSSRLTNNSNSVFFVMLSNVSNDAIQIMLQKNYGKTRPSYNCNVTDVHNVTYRLTTIFEILVEIWLIGSYPS